MKKNTEWILENKTNYKKIFQNQKEKRLDFVIENLLENRNLSLNTDFDFNPFDFKDMNIATKRIFEAIENNEKIYIYGDYDVDGITSVSLLYLALSELGADVHYYIPLRDEGYGLNKEAIQTLKSENTNLIISVDCGINSIEEVNLASELNLDFIITDHHEITGDIPQALAVINPKRSENVYSFKYLAGVGTAFMLVYALYTKKNKLDDISKYLDIVAIGTVADIVPLVFDNRKFVKKGLEILKNTRWTGIKQLLRKIFPNDWDTREYYSYDIGYIIAPIFNAAGRLEDAKQAVSLFIEEDSFKCLSIIDNLLENNSERKNLQKKILDLSIAEIEKKHLYNKNLILVANKTFHHGVIGIVASKILDKYYRPTMIMEIKENEGIATASCRSIDGINIVECLNSVSDILIKYGGHSGAAGFTIKIENIEELYKRMDKFIEINFNKNLFIKKLKIENVLAPYKVNYEFLKELEILEPYGAKNYPPIFAFRNCEYKNLRFTKNSTEHLMLDIKKGEYYFKNCIFFGGGDYYDVISNSKNIDIAFKLKLETFKDRYMCKLQLEDIKNSDENINFKDDYLELNGRDISFPIETVVYPKRLDIDDNLKLIFNDYGIAITKDRIIVENLDSNLANILNILKNKFNYIFSLKIKKKYLKSENINLHLEIDILKEKKINSFPLKEYLIFKEIKNILIGNFIYNSIQKKVLASIFKEKKPTLVIMKKGRGISTILNTIQCYYNYKNMFVSINDENKKADFYIFVFDFKYNIDLEKVFKILNKINSKNILIISNKDFNIENFEHIIDDYSIPKNIDYVDYNEISKIENYNNFYHPFLKDEEKEKLLELVKEKKEIFATREIVIHF